MRRYLLNRLWQSVVTLILATIVVFTGVRALPGDPALALAGEDRDPESLRAIRQQYGLDKSELVQFWQFVSHAVRGDLGQSIRTGEPVRTTRNSSPYRRVRSRVIAADTCGSSSTDRIVALLI